MIVKLGDIAIECKCTTGNKDCPIVGLEHLEPKELLLKNYSSDPNTTFTKSFKAGQILFGRRRSYQQKASVATFDGICSGDIIVIEAIPEKVEPCLLPFIIQNEAFFNYSIIGSAGGLSPRVKWQHLANYEFDLPSLEEQRVLADKLWTAYEVKESYKNLLAQTDKLLYAQFEKIQDEAKDQKLSSYIDIVRGVSYKPDDICKNDESSRVILRANNISNLMLNFDDIVFVKSERVKDIQLLKKGDVLMCASSGSQEHVGKVALVGENYTNVSFGAFCLVVRGHGIIPEYLFSLLGSSSFRNHIELMCNGTSILNIRREYIENWICPIADEQQQQEFVRVFNQAEQTKASLNKGIEAIEAVIRSLIAEGTTKV